MIRKIVTNSLAPLRGKGWGKGLRKKARQNDEPFYVCLE